MELKVTKLDKDFVKYETEYERYAFTNWKNISDILKKKKGNEVNDIECIVKIISGKKKVYRKCRSSNEFKKDEIALGYRTALKLGVKQDNDDKVVIKKSCRFPYLWYHIDSTIRVPFRVAVIALIFAILPLIETIINLLK
jgi:hypothetical protein